MMIFRDISRSLNRDVIQAWSGKRSENSSQLAIMICAKLPNIVYPINAADLGAWYLFLLSFSFSLSTAVFIFAGTEVFHQSVPFLASRRSAIRSRAEFSRQKNAVNTEAIFRAS